MGGPDPKLTYTASGKPVVTLRVAFTTGRSIEGEWRDKSNYIDVEVWGPRAESAATYLSKGRRIAVDGRLEWSEYRGRDGTKQQALRIVADAIQYLPDAGTGKARAPHASAEGADHEDSPDSDSTGFRSEWSGDRFRS